MTLKQVRELYGHYDTFFKRYEDQKVDPFGDIFRFKPWIEGQGFSGFENVNYEYQAQWVMAERRVHPGVTGRLTAYTRDLPHDKSSYIGYYGKNKGERMFWESERRIADDGIAYTKAEFKKSDCRYEGGIYLKSLRSAY